MNEDRQLYLHVNSYKADTDDVALYVSDLDIVDFADFFNELGRQHFLRASPSSWAEQAAHYLNNEAIDLIKDLVNALEKEIDE